MAASVSDVVIELLEGMYYLKPAMRLDLINYSALARVIKPFVEEKTGGKVELETIVMAIRRNVRFLTSEAYPSVLAIMKDTKVELRTGFAFVKLKRRPGVYEQVMDLVKTLNEEEAANSYVIQRVNEISVIIPEDVLAQIERLPAVKKDKNTVVAKRGELAVITINLPDESLDVPGVYALITTQLADLGVSILNTVGSFTRVSFLVTEEDAPLAYEKLTKLIRESKKLAARNF
ncbi:MAG: ACT domain-containing protein [Candidatus Micrarchaeota archaeon]